MRTFWTIVKNNLRIAILHKWISFTIITIIPIIILLLSSKFVNYTTTYVNVGIVDEDKTSASKAILDIMNDSEGMSIFHMDKDKVDDTFQSNKINVALIIDKGFEQKMIEGKIENIVIRGNEGQNVYILIKTLLKNHLLNIRNLAKVNRDKEKFEASLKSYLDSSSIVKKTSLNDLYAEYNNSNIFVGFLILFIFFKASSVANSINLDRERNVYTRIFLAPVKTWQYYLANVFCNLSISGLQLLVAILGMQYLSNTSIGISIPILFMILLVISTVAVALGTFYVAVTNDSDSASMLSNLMSLLFVMPGGCFIQVELFPDFIDRISYISPARWAMGSILDLQQGIAVVDVLPKIGVMMLFTVVFLGISFFVTAKKEKTFIHLG